MPKKKPKNPKEVIKGLKGQIHSLKTELEWLKVDLGREYGRGFNAGCKNVTDQLRALVGLEML